MATQSMQLDPNAQSYTDDEIVGKINTAAVDITRAGSVDPTARPIEAGEIGNDEIEAAAGIEKSKLAALAIVDADVDAAAAIAKTKLAALEIVDADVNAVAAIAKSKLAALEIVDADVNVAAAIVGSKLASSAAKDNLDAMAELDRSYIKTDPQTGDFKVLAVQRTAVGLFEVQYDDVPEA